MHTLRNIATGVALSFGLVAAVGAPTAAAELVTITVPPSDLATGNLDGDGVVVTARHGAPPGLGDDALGFLLDGAAERGSDAAGHAAVVDEASVNIAPRRARPLQRLRGLSYWTHRSARTGALPVLQVHLAAPGGDGHVLLQFAPSDNVSGRRGLRRGRWQHWDAQRRGRARWRVLRAEAGAPPATGDTRQDRTNHEDHERCDLSDCATTWRDVRERYGRFAVVEVRVVLARVVADRPRSGRSTAGATRSSDPGDAVVAAAVDGVRIGRLRYDFDGTPGHSGPHGRARRLAQARLS